jgi:hypothetical protein
MEKSSEHWHGAKVKENRVTGTVALPGVLSVGPD